MNIFVLDEDPEISAVMHQDLHVNKMILESAQILSTVHRLNKGSEKVYKKAFEKHPCTLWACKNKSNYNWLLQLAKNLVLEKEYRTGKSHASALYIRGELSKIPSGLRNSSNKLTQFATAMPEVYVEENPVNSYRNYYIGEKLFFNWGKGIREARWTGREIPNWISYRVKVENPLASLLI